MSPVSSLISVSALALALAWSGAVPAAALLYGKVPLKGKRVVALLSGGNVDLAALCKWIEEVRTGN